jgi:hypothetical protein
MKYLGPNYKKYIKNQNIFPQAFCNLSRINDYEIRSCKHDIVLA